jgi:hypothetical protein
MNTRIACAGERAALSYPSSFRLARLLWFGASALLLLGGQPAYPAETAPAGVRFDGIYAVTVDSEKSSAGQPRCVAVRLYPDAYCVEVDFFGQPTDCVKQINRENEDLFPGTWQLTGATLKVVISDGGSESTREGTMTDEGWQITPKVLFRFVPIDFPPVAAAENRRPLFRGAGKSVRRFAYDAAGNLVGINDEIEIQAEDPDQDPLTYTWKASNGIVTAEKQKAVWKRAMVNGEAEFGTLTVEVSDGRGGKVTTTFSRH